MSTEKATHYYLLLLFITVYSNKILLFNWPRWVVFRGAITKIVLIHPVSLLLLFSADNRGACFARKEERDISHYGNLREEQKILSLIAQVF